MGARPTAASRRTGADAACEARAILRAMLRDKRAKYRLGAAGLAALPQPQLRVRARATAAADETVIREAEAFRKLRSMSDEDLDSAIERSRMKRGEQECVGGAGI